MVNLDAVDDNLLDGDQLDVTFTGSAAPYLDGSDVVDVLDYEALTLTIDPDTIVENAGPGASTGTVSRTPSGPRCSKGSAARATTRRSRRRSTTR